MKRRTVQILLALLVIIYRKTWFWWIFNHFAGRLVPASREFFQILSFLEFSVTFLAILYLLVFEGRRILELKWKWRYPVYLLLAYGVSYLSGIVFSFLTPATSNQIAFKWIDWDDRATRVTLSFTYCLSARTNYRRIGISRSSDEYISERFTMVWRCFAISCVFGYVHVSSGLTPLAFFTYASGGAILCIPLPKNSFSLFIPFCSISWLTWLHFGNYGC